MRILVLGIVVDGVTRLGLLDVPLDDGACWLRLVEGVYIWCCRCLLYRGFTSMGCFFVAVAYL